MRVIPVAATRQSYTTVHSVTWRLCGTLTRMQAVRGREGVYGELRRTIVAAGLLQRSYAYYFARSTVSFAILAGGVCLAFSAASSAWVALPAAAAIIAFGSVQVALIGHDAGHFSVFKSRAANTTLGSVCWSLAL